MRVLICSICCLFLFCYKVSAQNSADCRTAIPVCADQPIMGIAGGSGDVDDFDPLQADLEYSITSGALPTGLAITLNSTP